MYAMRNKYGVSVNETALCAVCVQFSEHRRGMMELWRDADDTGPGVDMDFYPVDNRDARCNGLSCDE